MTFVNKNVRRTFLADLAPSTAFQDRTSPSRNAVLRATIQWASILVLVLLVGSCSDSPGTEPYHVTIDVAPWIKDLGSADPSTSEAAVEHFVSLREAALPPLRQALQQEGPAVRVSVVDALVQLNLVEAVPSLLIAAKDADPNVRAEALLGLGELEDERGRELVEAALADDDRRIALAAADACISLCRSAESLRLLTKMALYDPPFVAMAVPRQTLRYIARQEEPRADTARETIRTLSLPLLEQETPLEARTRAALLLTDIGDTSGLSWLNEVITRPLDDLSHEQQEQLRIQAMLALGTMGDETSVNALARARKTLGPPLTQSACRALAQLMQRHVGNAAVEAARCNEGRQGD